MVRQNVRILRHLKMPGRRRSACTARRQLAPGPANGNPPDKYKGWPVPAKWARLAANAGGHREVLSHVLSKPGVERRWCKSLLEGRPPVRDSRGYETKSEFSRPRSSERNPSGPFARPRAAAHGEPQMF